MTHITASSTNNYSDRKPMYHGASARADSNSRVSYGIILALIMLIILLTMGDPGIAYAGTEGETSAPEGDYLYDSPKFSNYDVRKKDSEGNSTIVYTASDTRKAACRMMNKMANVEWKVDKTFTYDYASNQSVKIKKTLTYYGIPYTQYNRIYPEYDSATVNDRITKASTKADSVKGLDCSSAVSYALRSAKGKTDSATYLMGKSSPYVSNAFLFDGMRDDEGVDVSLSGKNITYRNNLRYVGWYGNYKGYSGAKDTLTIIDGLSNAYPTAGGDIYSNVYAKIRPGDALVKVNPYEGHVIMVTGVRLVYDENNKIDPLKSHVVMTDQNDPYIRYEEGLEWSSSWRRNYSGPYSSFVSLKALGYLPVTAFSNTSTYTIKYDSKGGSVTPKAQTKSFYEGIRLSDRIPRKSGYTFLGWKPKNDPIKRIYLPGEYYNADKSDTMTAVWQKNSSDDVIKLSSRLIEVGISYDTTTYSGKVKTPKVESVRAGGVKLPSGSYTVTYADGRKNVGKYSIKIKLGGNYKGSKTVYFKIRPKASPIKELTALSGGLRVKYTKVTPQCTGYQIQYSLNKDFSTKKSVNITSYKTVSKKITGLKGKTRYYVRVRTYKTVNGTKYWSKWSKTRYIKTLS